MDERPQNALNHFSRSRDLIDQVLKIDPRNEKALTRKLSILVELGETKAQTPIFKLIEDVAFQSDRSQVVYNNIKKLRDRIDENPVPLAQRKPQIKKKRDETTPVGTSN